MTTEEHTLFLLAIKAVRPWRTSKNLQRAEASVRVERLITECMESQTPRLGRPRKQAASIVTKPRKTLQPA